MFIANAISMEKTALIVSPFLLHSTERYKEMFSNQRGIRSGGGEGNDEIWRSIREALDCACHRRRRRRRRLFVHPFEINNRVDRVETGPLFASKYRYDADDD